MKLTTIKSLAAAALCAVGLSSFAAEPEAVQLWEGGPYWATVNVGTSEVQDHLEYGGRYTFANAAQAVTDALGEGWRLPTKDEFKKLIDTSVCERTWDNEKKGCLFTSKDDSSKSIFFPAAGKVSGFGPQDVGSTGYYWSSTASDDSELAYSLTLSQQWGIQVTDAGAERGFDFSVRAVRDTPLPPSVTVDKVESVDPWDSTKGTIKVNYTLGGVDAKLDYKVAFDITAGGQTASVTNDAAKVTDGAATKEIDTATLFGKEVVDAKAKVKVSLIAVKAKKEIPAGIQLWANGPFWAESNLGDSEVEGHSEYGALYTFDNADAAVKSLLGEEWRLPTVAELKMLDGETSGYCTKTWDGNKKGYTFTGATEGYKDKSIFLPAAGIDYCDGRELAEGQGYYWSSGEEDANCAGNLDFYEGNASVKDSDRSYGLSVRAVRDAK